MEILYKRAIYPLYLSILTAILVSGCSPSSDNDLNTGNIEYLKFSAIPIFFSHVSLADFPFEIQVISCSPNMVDKLVQIRKLDDGYFNFYCKPHESDVKKKFALGDVIDIAGELKVKISASRQPNNPGMNGRYAFSVKTQFPLIHPNGLAYYGYDAALRPYGDITNIVSFKVSINRGHSDLPLSPISIQFNDQRKNPNKYILAEGGMSYDSNINSGEFDTPIHTAEGDIIVTQLKAMPYDVEHCRFSVVFDSTASVQ